METPVSEDKVEKSNSLPENLYSYRPVVLNFEQKDDKVILNELFLSNRIEVLDYSSQMWKEWFKLSNPDKNWTDSDLNMALESSAIEQDFRYVFYPWKNTLVKLLNKEKFRWVRTNRNKNKITEQEQQVLFGKTVGVVGLSVGNSVAVTLAMESAAGKIVLADFDSLELSNLNRIRASIFDINLPKVVITARQIAEIDPYIDVEVFQDGVTDENISSITANLDLIVEVCDAVDVKIQLRKLAKTRRIPLLMDTNDRGMIDIERYDLDGTLPIFLGRESENVLDNIRGLNPQERMAVLMKLMDGHLLSDRLKASMGEIGKTISTWPQLASSVMLGGGITTIVARKILLGESVPHGRYYVDVEDIVK